MRTGEKSRLAAHSTPSSRVARAALLCASLKRRWGSAIGTQRGVASGVRPVDCGAIFQGRRFLVAFRSGGFFSRSRPRRSRRCNVAAFFSHSTPRFLSMCFEPQFFLRHKACGVSAPRASYSSACRSSRTHMSSQRRAHRLAPIMCSEKAHSGKRARCCEGARVEAGSPVSARNIDPSGPHNLLRLRMMVLAPMVACTFMLPLSSLGRHGHRGTDHNEGAGPTTDIIVAVATVEVCH